MHSLLPQASHVYTHLNLHLHLPSCGVPVSCLLTPPPSCSSPSARLHRPYGVQYFVRLASHSSSHRRQGCPIARSISPAQDLGVACAKLAKILREACRLRLGSPWLQGAAELNNGEARESYRKGTKIREMGFCYCPGFLEDCRLLRSEFGWTGNRLA
jgi:hypothetical protein